MNYAGWTPERRPWLLMLAAGLAGCGTRSLVPASSSGSTGSSASSAVPAPSAPDLAPADALEAERAWLQSWFDGTPVRIALRGDGRLAVDVPREFCFAPGSAKIKTALAAVLDKVAESLRRRPQLRLESLAAPSDEGGARVLAAERGQRIRRHLRDRGVPEARLAAVGSADTAALQLLLR
jgi:outer membrane protein OmpA-like peptidoglycan-associated protein